MGQLTLPDQREKPEISRHFQPERKMSVMRADALEACRELPDEFFSLIVSSPPYNIGKNYEQKIDFESYLEDQKAVIAELVRVLKSDGSLCWQVGNYVDRGEVYPLDMYFYPVFKSLGLQLRNRIVWHFGHGLHAKKRFSGRYETLLWFTKSDRYLFNLDPVRVPSKYPGKRHYKGAKKGRPSGNPLGKNPSDFWALLQSEFDDCVWDIPNVKANHPEKIPEHPCQFPIELVERCVLSMTREGDWVLDPYGGVGSAAIAALKHDRRAVSIDRDEIFCDITCKRVVDFYAGKLKMRSMGKPVHKPSGNEQVSQMPIEWHRGMTFQAS